ncbi:HAMP domain-containing sensor histidine kinase [Pedobacter sp. FW305-3-2-15-E-R2A2]|jgi:nitrogen fixation/metabolism regulation signal transduction histidine kinase|uniref:sensor histidine kinase n=1 Tax=Pedobacter sp. FW305-3-2-15-E-R2A2 TaxID=3140251 RepID=UPI0031405A9F
MIFKHLIWRTIRSITLLFIPLAAASYCLVQGWFSWLIPLSILIIYLMVSGYRSQLKMYREFEHFIEAVRYQDFSLHFEVKHAPPELKPLRKGFNDINAAFKQLSREKETQYQYLKKILELIDTGILSYQTENGEVIWMNESLKEMLQIPYLKTITSLGQRDEKLHQEIISLKSGESKIAGIQNGDQTLKVLLSATAFQTGSLKFQVIAFQNLNEVLDETEAKAWQKLLSVLTHELMNSIAPISSLAGTLKNRLSALERTAPYTAVFEDLEMGIETIQRRSEGLLRFAETYRNLNKTTAPVMEQLQVRPLLENIYQLMQPTLQQKNIELELILADAKLLIKADHALMEQVLINLLLNAVDALKDQANPKIILSAENNEKGKVAIRVTDNGCGIPTEMTDSIFVPFFSTKKSGGGIGLPLCKQIVMLHHGQIQFHSVEGLGSSFIISL